MNKDRFKNGKRKTPKAKPLPGKFIPPMLAVLSAMPRQTGDYAYEFKWDGYRSLAYCEGGKAAFRSRKDQQLYYPELENVNGLTGGRNCILDGEIVALNSRGEPDFGLLQKRMGMRGRKAVQGLRFKTRVIYVAFDLLHDGRQFLLKEPYRIRRHRLQDLLTVSEAFKITPAEWSDPEAVMDVARHHGMEGIIAKRLNSIYRPGRRLPDWLKIKFVRKQEFVVGGWTEGQGGAGGALGSLMLGYYEDGQLQYAGNVGTGFSHEERSRLRREFSGATGPNPFNEPVRGAGIHFVRPERVAEISFRGWTQGGRVRQASFEGFRFDKKAHEVIKEEA